MTLDKSLNFKEHIKTIKAKSLSKLNIIKMLRKSSYGSDPYTLLKILNTIVLPTIDYACIIYMSSSNSNLKILDPILNTGIRLALGAFRTSPANSLQAISNLPPLNIRRIKHLLNYTLKIYVMKNHPIKEKVKNIEQTTSTKIKSKRYKLFYERAEIEFEDIEKKYNITQHRVEPLGNAKIPPWSFLNFTIDFSIAYCDKENMIPVIVEKKFLEALNKTYANHEKFYTDGSVMNTKSGFAITGNDQNIMYRICDYSSIYTCELLAIKTCIEHIIVNQSQNQKNLIICDSMSALEGLQDIYSKNILINQIRTMITESKVKVTFIWVPSHLNIGGNELVDSLAKSSLNLTVSTEFFMQYSDYRTVIKKHILDIWNNYWKTGNESKLYEIQKSVSLKSLKYKIAPLDLIKWYRLRIGHCNFSHKFLIEKNSPPQCECGQNLTVKHIFNECTILSSSRIKFHIQDINILSHEREFYTVKQFLQEISFYNLI